MRMKLVALSLLSALLALPGANAQAVRLTCTDVQDKTVSFQIILNENESTAGYEGVPPSKAKFTDTEVTWDYVNPAMNNEDEVYTLNRMTVNLSRHVRWSNSTQNYQCVVAQRKI